MTYHIALSDEHDDLGLVRQGADEPEDNAEYVRAILRRAYAEIALLGGTRRTPWHENRYAEVLHGIDGLIDEHVPEPPTVAEQLAALSQPRRAE